MSRTKKEHKRAPAAGRPAPPATGHLSRGAFRLLTALSADQAVASRDAFRDDAVFVQARRDGVTLGRGTHAFAALRELQSRGLAHLVGPGRTGITEEGRAHLRRAEPEAADAPFASQHRELHPRDFVDETGRERLAVNVAESPLEWLRRRRGRDGEPLIDAAAFEAGERLRRDLTFAGMLPSVTARWGAAAATGATGGPRDPAGATDAVIAARQRVRTAMAEVGGDFADLLVDLCGFLKGLETIERDRRWPPRSGKVVVRLALRRLADHYGLASEARGLDVSRALRSWTAPTEEVPA